jgi:hypothetical protein
MELPGHFECDVSDGLIRMKYDGLTIVSVMAYRP